MKALFRYIFLIVILCAGFVAKAETMYPIQLTAAMLPPYTNSLGDYFNDKMHRLKLTAVVRDRQEQHKHLDVFVKIIVKQGSSQKAPVFVTRTLHTPYAMMYDIPTDGIAAQLASDNDGYVVPEGAYEFIFQIFDAHNDRLPLSEPTSVFCYLAEAEAPECIYPVDNSCIPITVSNGQSNQPVVLTWMDRTTTNLAFRKYIVELYSDDVATGASEDLNPMFGGDDVIGKHLILQKEVNNVNFLSIANNAGVSFTNGKKYYWHVAGVSAGNDGSMTNYARSFNNKLHYSALSSFTYGCEKEKPEINYDEELVVKGISTNNSAVSATITWGVKDNDDPSALDKYCGYRLYFTPKVKKADNEENTENVDQSNQNAEDNADNKAALSDAGTSDSDSNTENKENEENTLEEKKTVVVEVGKTTTYTLNAIERSKEYDVAVQGILCDDASAELKISEPKSFMIPEEEKKNCDVNLHPVECTSLLELKEGEWFYANDNDAIVKISTLPKDGNLGTGVVTCTLFKEKLGLIVKFDDKVKVNTDHYLCEGEVVVDSEGDRSAMLNVNDVAGKGRTAPKAAFQKELKTAETKEAITSSEKNEAFRNNVVANGDNVYAVTKDGTAAEIGEVTSDVTPSQGSLDNESGVIVFQRDEKLNKSWSPYIDYSAAPITETSIINEYERMGGSYIVPWASMECGETRWVKAVPQLANNDNKKLSEFKNVVFYARIGDKYIKLKHEVLDEAACTYKVQLFGGEANKSYPVYAMNSSKTKTYGRLNVYNMKYKKYKIRIVPVVNDVTFNGALYEYQKKLNEIFSPLAKEFDLELSNKAFTNSDIVTPANGYSDLSFLDDGLNTGDGIDIMAYKTEETRALLNLYKQNNGDDDADAYFFLVPKLEKDGLLGFMPRTYTVGFLATNTETSYPDHKTMAHELCHGLFGLEHIFEYEGVARGSYNINLLDYSEGDFRYPSKYFQWYNIENPSDYHFPFVDDAGDGELLPLAVIAMNAARIAVTQLIKQLAKKYAEKYLRKILVEFLKEYTCSVLVNSIANLVSDDLAGISFDVKNHYQEIFLEPIIPSLESAVLSVFGKNTATVSSLMRILNDCLTGGNLDESTNGSSFLDNYLNMGNCFTGVVEDVPGFVLTAYCETHKNSNLCLVSKDQFNNIVANRVHPIIEGVIKGSVSAMIKEIQKIYDKLLADKDKYLHSLVTLEKSCQDYIIMQIRYVTKEPLFLSYNRPRVNLTFVNSSTNAKEVYVIGEEQFLTNYKNDLFTIDADNGKPHYYEIQKDVYHTVYLMDKQRQLEFENGFTKPYLMSVFEYYEKNGSEYKDSGYREFTYEIIFQAKKYKYFKIAAGIHTEEYNPIFINGTCNDCGSYIYEFINDFHEGQVKN